jgi:hypothetical protein
MQRFQQLLFVVSILAISWLAMMAIHELGHVLGAIVTGGTVERVVLHPLSISRTDVSPNPHPAAVVWLGPIVGSVVPLAALAVIPQRLNVLRVIARFFAGFCLVVNGAYISLGWINQVGDCGEMLRTGTPVSVLVMFGFATVPLGLYLWHRLGSIDEFISRPSLVTGNMAFGAALTLVVIIAVESALSPR